MIKSIIKLHECFQALFWPYSFAVIFPTLCFIHVIVCGSAWLNHHYGIYKWFIFNYTVSVFTIGPVATAPLNFLSAWVKVSRDGDPLWPDIQVFFNGATIAFDKGTLHPGLWGFDKTVSFMPLLFAPIQYLLCICICISLYTEKHSLLWCLNVRFSLYLCNIFNFLILKYTIFFKYTIPVKINLGYYI